MNWNLMTNRQNNKQTSCDKIFLFNLFFVQLLDYSILLKARHDELIHESITLHYHELNLW